VGAVVDQAWEGIRRAGRSGEVIVVDNGSADRSAEVAAAGESKLRRLGDGWRHVRFMLLSSPSWLFLGPGTGMLLLGLAGMLAVAGEPADVLGRRWQIHALLALVALTLIGAQLVQLWALARTYARTHLGERDPVHERVGRLLTIERSVLAGASLALAGAGILAWIAVPWALDDFGELRHEYATAPALTLLGLGLQVVFSSFLVGLLAMRAAETSRPRGEIAAEAKGELPPRRALTTDR